MPLTREERLANLAKGRQARSQRAAAKRAPSCHPDREQVGKTGLCHECYIGGTGGGKQLSIQDAIKIAEKHADPAFAKILKQQALALLMEQLPIYAQLHIEAAKMAALKGDARPAEWALTTIREAGGQAVVEPAAAKPAPDAGGIKIFFGVNLGGAPKELAASNPIDAVVSTDERTS